MLKGTRFISVFLVLSFFATYLGLHYFSVGPLWKKVNYTNNEALDLQLQNLAKRDDWNLVILGSSEVRWGFEPLSFENELVANGINHINSFNLGIDNFGLGSMRLLLPYMKIEEMESLKNLKAVLIGINLNEVHNIKAMNADLGLDCSVQYGPAQNTVYKSAWVFDNGGDVICHASIWQRVLFRYVARLSPVVRYRKQLRGYFLRSALKSGEDLLQNERGAYIRSGMTKADYDHDFGRYIRDEIPHFGPLNNEEWALQLKENGTIFEVMKFFRSKNIFPIFYALPTHPDSIVLQKRVENYHFNSKVMAAWATQNNVGFFDLGLKFDYDKYSDFTDHRHLSGKAAVKFSREVAKALAKTDWLKF